ncbi:winged helix-turn-helix domain-containing protein [Gracilibacillus saliphilus]|uniref:winged helix-turn-helix domain-containing protein n=1 Tax=Gracilibacillus saliphilus TaxID=543890 RepID=UPI0013D8873D|nr:winged helix-turn-helix domain-containing protein [Gracilibacillus saliphilus]
MNLSFQTDNYSVTYAGEIVQLLRKEFALLQYLFNNANHAFTREELLNAVWPLEAPSDRTVDDHVYRLRKKLNTWNHFMSIDTVKGYGYRLRVHDQQTGSPLVHDEEFKRLASHLFNKYHLFGQGAALNTLIQQEALGIEVERSMRVIIAFMKGDVANFINTEEFSFSEKALFHFYFYMMITDKPDQVIVYYENARKKDIFSNDNRDEAMILSPVTFYILARDFEKARKHFEIANDHIAQESGFYPFLQLNLMMYHMCLNEPSKVTTTINHMNDFFSEKPYQREFGLFHVLKGLFTIQQGKNEQGKGLIHKGLHITRQTRFQSHIFLTIKISLFMLQHYIHEPDLYKQLNTEWSTFNQDYDFEKIEAEIDRQLKEHL